MRVTTTKLDGVMLLEHDIYYDIRGYFYESFNAQKWKKLGLPFQPVQENHSFSLHTGTVRGLHYQLQPRAQAKAVRVLTGAVFDVILDLRKESATFGSWVSVLLSEFSQMLSPRTKSSWSLPQNASARLSASEIPRLVEGMEQMYSQKIGSSL